MKQVTQILEHRFPSGGDWDIAGLSVSLDDLATRLGIDLQSWDEDGLGPARGAFIRLPSGRVVLIRELAHAAKHLGWRGTDVVADAGDLVALGVGPLVDEVVSAFGLSDGLIAWAAGEGDRQKTAEVLEAWRTRQTCEHAVAYDVSVKAMKEEYKFVGFSSDIELYAEVERYVVDLLREILATLPDHQQWSIITIKYGRDVCHDEQELVRRRFFASPETVVIRCCNSQSSKGVQLQIDDPTAVTLNEDFRVSFTERPAMFSALMDTVDEDGDQFSEDLVIVCELTKRTEFLAVDLIRRYLSHGLSYDDMALHAQELSDREAQLWEQWKSEHRR